MATASTLLRRTAGVALTLTLMASPAACSSPATRTESTPGTAATGSRTASSALGSTTPTAPAPTVSLIDYDIHPRKLEIRPGDTVTWINDDEADHWMVALDPDVLDSGRMRKADSYTRTFTRPGEYLYYCQLHNYMKGSIVVR